MKSIQDAIFNWLTIKLVYDKRPHDQAAEETYQLFSNILKDEHKIRKINVKQEEDMYIVSFKKNGNVNSYRFPTELAEMLIKQIEEEPEKY